MEKHGCDGLCIREPRGPMVRGVQASAALPAGQLFSRIPTTKTHIIIPQTSYGSLSPPYLSHRPQSNLDTSVRSIWRQNSFRVIAHSLDRIQGLNFPMDKLVTSQSLRLGMTGEKSSTPKTPRSLKVCRVPRPQNHSSYRSGL